MKLPVYILGLFFTVQLVFCTAVPDREIFRINPNAVLKDFGTWWIYNCRNIHLSTNYIPLDTSSKPISREAFLKSLASGEYIGFRVNAADPALRYQLYRLGTTTNKDIRATARQFGESEYARFLMEGKEIPDFNFKDVNGRVYTKANTKGKIVVLKCWFIHCTVCIQEMPALNTFVKEFKGRDDVLFISLAFDPEKELKSFLTKTKFEYAVIHTSQEYIRDKLGVYEYPTQFIINREGSIVKVVNDYHDMISLLKDELAK